MNVDACTEYGVQEPRDIDSNTMTGVSGYAGVIQYTWGIEYPMISPISRAKGSAMKSESVSLYDTTVLCTGHICSLLSNLISASILYIINSIIT